MDTELKRLHALSKIIAEHIPKTKRASGHAVLGYVEKHECQASHDYSLSIHSSCEFGSDFFGLSSNQVEPDEIARAIFNARTILSKLCYSDRSRLLEVAGLKQDQEHPATSFDTLIKQLFDLENAAMSREFKRRKLPFASGKRKWRAAAIAASCRNVWEQENGPGSVPKAVNHLVPSAFGRFLNDVLVWAGERTEHGEGTSASAALRSYQDWLRTQE